MSIPDEYRTLLDGAFDVVDDQAVRADINTLATNLYGVAYNAKLKNRTSADNRKEHELVVLRNTVRICWRSGVERASQTPFTVSELRIAVATSILHDLRFIPRVTEEMIADSEQRGDMEEAARLRKKKATQRMEHMRGGVADAAALLSDNPSLLTDVEAKQVLALIGLHDIWKLGWPYPATTDWLAVCCLEGDALWPLDTEFGTLADLERKGDTNPTFEVLQTQAASNFEKQLCAYRSNFTSPYETFQDAETIMRTTEGANILNEYRTYWKI